MNESIYTTPQSSKTPKSKSARYSSPYQVIDLNNESQEDLKTRLLEAENIIQDLRSERDALHESLVDKAGLNESVIIERSNKVSTQETRIYRRDVTLLEDDLKQKESQIRILQNRCLRLETEKQKMQDTISGYQEDLKENEIRIENLNSRLHKLEDELSAKTHEIFSIGEELKNKTMKLNEKNSQFQTKLAEISSENRNLERKVQKFREELIVKDQRSLEVHQDQENTQKVLKEVKQLSDRLDYLTPKRKDVSRIKERDDFLQFSAKIIEETMSELKLKNARLERELSEKEELVKVTKEELQELQKTVTQAMGDSEQATKYLHAENMKLTRQKADIRCDLLEARRNLKGFDEKREELEKQRDEALEDVRRITELKKNVEIELRSLKLLAEEREEQIDELKSRVAGYEVLRRDHEAVKNELAKAEEKLNKMGAHLVMADKQSSHFKTLKETAEGSRRRAIEQCNEMVARIRGLEASLENQRKVEQELEMVKAENVRQAKKIEFMKEEIQETHLDYREELSKLAKGGGSHEADSQRDSELRSAKKTIQEVKADNKKLQQILEEVRQNQSKVLEENVKLRKGMAEAIEKIEEFKRNWHSSREAGERLQLEAKENEEKVLKVEEELQEKRLEVLEKEELVNYLQSQINTKQTKQPKLSRRSTLMSTISEVDTSTYVREVEEVRALEEQREELQAYLAEKRKMADLQKSRSTANTTTLITSTTATEVSKSACELSYPPATMRHDIPHKWLEFRHYSVLSMKCSLCFVGITFFTKANKCSHCDVRVHASCAPRVNNTCGIPAQCATYYQDAQAVGGIGRMNGWLRVYRDDLPESTWTSLWAMMDSNHVKFYRDAGADNLENPYFTIDLNKEQWILRTGQEVAIPGDVMRNVLTIKLQTRSVHIVAPTPKSAERWAACLQNAQTRRMMKNSKPSSIAEYSCLLTLSLPNNLKIFKAHTIEDWILFATQTGLFFTSISQPRNPTRIAGPSSVTSLEVMSEINCVAMITNSNRQLALIPLDSLTLAMQSTHPSIRAEVLPEFGHVHTIRYHQQDGQRFLLVSDDTQLHIRKYNSTRDVFAHFAKLVVPEPVSFIESTPAGFIFASDTFYYVPLDHQSPSDVSARKLMPPRRSDYPVSAHAITANEILLAYQNHGIFVNLYGEQSRNQIIEWEKMPIEFAYTSPLLYIVHDDSIEIVQISKSSKETVLAEREVIACVNAHIVQSDGVLISVSSKDITEVHRFSATCRGTGTKRRGISPFNTLKRSKN